MYFIGVLKDKLGSVWKLGKYTSIYTSIWNPSYCDYTKCTMNVSVWLLYYNYYNRCLTLYIFI